MTGRLLRMAAFIAIAALLAASCGDDDGTNTAADVPTSEAAATTVAVSDEDSTGDADSADGAPADEDDAESNANDTTETASPDPDPDPDPTALAELEVVAVVYETNMIQIQNTGTDDVSLDGLWICQRPGYERLPPISLGPAEGIQFELPGGVDELGGEAAIYTSDDFGSADAVVSYVHWGTGGGRASVAEAAGKWSGPPVEPLPDGLFLDGEPGSAAGWG